MKYYGFICLIVINQLLAMDKPQRPPESVKHVINAPRNVALFDWFFKELQKEGVHTDYTSSQINAARYLLLDDNLLNQFALRHNISTAEIKKMIERFFYADTQRRINMVVNSPELRSNFKKNPNEQEISDLMLLIAITTEYISAQKYDATQGENYFRSRTSQELEFIKNSLNKVIVNDQVINQFLDFEPKGLVTLTSIKLGIAKEVAARSIVTLTKNQQKNADTLFGLYAVGKIDLETYLPLQTNSELDRIKSYLDDAKTPSVRNYLLQKISSTSLDRFINSLELNVKKLIRLRSKPKQLPEGLNAQEQLLFRFVERYMKDGDTLKTRYHDQDKTDIKKAAHAIIENPKLLDKLAEWLLVAPHVAKTLMTRATDLFKANESQVKSQEDILKNPWPEYPQEESIEKARPVAQLPIIQERARGFTVQDFITYALENNPSLNDRIKDSSEQQLAAVLTQVNGLIAADEKVVKKYQERFEITPRRDLAKLRLLLESINQELKRRKEELFSRHPVNKPHPEYPESPR